MGHRCFHQDRRLVRYVEVLVWVVFDDFWPRAKALWRLRSTEVRCSSAPAPARREGQDYFCNVSKGDNNRDTCLVS